MVIEAKLFSIAVHDEATLTSEVLRGWLAPHLSNAGRWQRLRRFFRWRLDPEHQKVTMGAVAAMRQFDRPVLLVWGVRDTNFGLPLAQRLARDIPGVQGIHQLERSAHMPMVEEPKAYAAAVISFFDDGRVDDAAIASATFARQPPIVAIANLARETGALVHTDAAQSLGKVPVHVRQLGVDLLSVAGHKLYAPKGVGALYVKRSTPLAPSALGASHERGLRPGTENVASIVGLGVACEVAAQSLELSSSRQRQLRDELWSLLGAGVPGLALSGHAELRLPNTLNVRFPRVLGSAVLAAAPEIAASTGSACHDGHETASAVILSMGVPASEAVGAVRLSLGRTTTNAEIVSAANALVRAWRSLVQPQ